jgi:hypothetical protein
VIWGERRGEFSVGALPFGEDLGEVGLRTTALSKRWSEFGEDELDDVGEMEKSRVSSDECVSRRGEGEGSWFSWALLAGCAV